MSQYGSDRDLLEKALTWLYQGHALRLVTVLKTWGSSPRPPGSLMVMRRDGVHAGSVSGGCVEADLLQRFGEDELGSDKPTLIDYGVDRQEATRFGLPCGGRLELLVEPLNDPAQLQALVDAMARQALLLRRVSLPDGAVTLESAGPELTFHCTEHSVARVFGPQWQMLLIGAGHLSQFVSQMALMLDYRVTVCDPREEYARAWAVAETELSTAMPDDAVQAFAAHERSIVVALTHDPKLDDMALLDALQGQAFYVGAIGSQRNCEARRKRLRQMGLTPQQLERLHAPVGLDIGSHTPPEIAVSILAEITARRNAVRALDRKAATAA